MNTESIFSLLLLIAVLYLAFRIGAILLRVLLGLVAIGLFIWFLTNVLGVMF